MQKLAIESTASRFYFSVAENFRKFRSFGKAHTVCIFQPPSGPVFVAGAKADGRQCVVLRSSGKATGLTGQVELSGEKNNLIFQAWNSELSLFYKFD